MVDGSLLTLSDVLGWVRAPKPSDDKYSRGVAGFFTGSEQYPGAARLGVEAALHTGVGMVRYRGPSSLAEQLISHRPEVVKTPGHVSSLVVGSGWPQLSADEAARLTSSFDGSESVPVVLDAGALPHASLFQGPRVLTPHHREMVRLCSLSHRHDFAEECAIQRARDGGVVVLLKGHHTVVVTPQGVAYRLPPATPWLATAGTGDVLAGILGALLAAPTESPRSLEEVAKVAGLAALIHQEAAHRLSRQFGAGVPGPFTALELARSVGPVVASLAQPAPSED